ncbi:hypothetical protein ACSQ67_016892 [Phaseolus vulgaris]
MYLNIFIAKCRVNLFYNLMEELWGAYCAIGHGVRMSRQVQHHIHRQIFIVDLNDNMKYISEELAFNVAPEQNSSIITGDRSYNPSPTRLMSYSAWSKQARQQPTTLSL